MAIDKEKIQQLRERSKRGGVAVRLPSDFDLGFDPDGDEPVSFPWRLDDGRVTVTHEQCNAIREAAHDGVMYTRIAELYSFVADRDQARRHSKGECMHEGGVPVVGERDHPQMKITHRECRRMRREFSRNDQSYREYVEGEQYCLESVYRHIVGDCRHG